MRAPDLWPPNVRARSASDRRVRKGAGRSNGTLVARSRARGTPFLVRAAETSEAGGWELGDEIAYALSNAMRIYIDPRLSASSFCESAVDDIEFGSPALVCFRPCIDKGLSPASFSCRSKIVGLSE